VTKLQFILNLLERDGKERRQLMKIKRE